MVIAIILSGGTGIRMGNNRPKQYLDVEGRPILGYCLPQFEMHQVVDQVIIVAAMAWQDYKSNLVRNLKMKNLQGSPEREAAVNRLFIMAFRSKGDWRKR